MDAKYLACMHMHEVNNKTFTAASRRSLRTPLPMSVVLQVGEHQADDCMLSVYYYGPTLSDATELLLSKQERSVDRVDRSRSSAC